MEQEKHTTERNGIVELGFGGTGERERERERVMQGKFKKKINVKSCNLKDMYV